MSYMLHSAMYLVTQRRADNEPNSLRRLIARRETRALAKYEAQLCAKYDQVVFVTDDDRRAIESQFERFNVHVPGDRFGTIPICGDPSDKQPSAPVAEPHRIAKTFRSPKLQTPPDRSAACAERSAFATNLHHNGRWWIETTTTSDIGALRGMTCTRE